ncbi:MAG: ribonuclease J [Candidatus Saccharimonadales bacterium]
MKQQKNSDIRRRNRRKTDTIDRDLRRYRTTKVRALPALTDKLRIVPLGGQNGIGEKNLIVLEYGNDALILDCGFELGIDLPGINYAIPVTDYLDTIKHKLRGYVISHGHMDHICGLVHILPQYPSPVFGSRFTIGMVQAQFEKAREDGLEFPLETQVLDMDTHEKVILGALQVELVRVTHSIPESSAIVVDTPAGRVINTGDFRLDPEPLDSRPTDISRLKQLGDEGVLLLMSESTNTTRLGRTPTEHSLQKSFDDIMSAASGRVFAAVFSSNMNRVQMIITAAHNNGRKVAFDGRSMMATAELAVRLGNLNVPKDTLVAMADTAKLPDKTLVVICTGGQGEPGAAMSRMSTGEHRFIKLKSGDSVIISSTPIPGNERSYQQVGDDLALIGVTQFRHPTHEIDGCGPLHVSGHGNRDESAEMIQLTKPRYLLPIYGGALNRQYHAQVGKEAGLQSQQILLADNGDVVELSRAHAPRLIGKVSTGSLLVDQTGSVVPEIVTRDRLLLQGDGFMVVMVTLDKRSGRLLSSPDIITRGAIAVRDNALVLDSVRALMRQQLISLRKIGASMDTIKQSLQVAASKALYQQTKQTPMVIVVVNTVSGRGKTNIVPRPIAETCS